MSLEPGSTPTTADAAVGEPRASDPYAARRALHATGALRALNDAEVLDAADIHIASRLAELAGEPDERVVLAAALAVRGVRRGSVCVDLAEAPHLSDAIDWPTPQAWQAAIEASPLVGPGRPLSYDLDRLYLERYWRQEAQVCADLLARVRAAAPQLARARFEAALARLFPDPSWAEQRAAASRAARQWLTVLGGGPGTGKTTTVARLLALIADQPGPAPRVALAAPTGKAAARLQEAVLGAAADLDPADAARVAGLTASTIHRLLGWRGGGGRFRHDRDNRLPYDVVVIDETSMVSLTLMARLLEAVRPDARLVLVGDPDQLASIEAGAVLADVVAGLSALPTPPALPASPAQEPTEAVETASAPSSAVVLLSHTWRFGGAIAELATAIRLGETERAVAVLEAPSAEVSFHADGARAEILAAATAVREAAAAGDAEAALAALATQRVLCAHRSGSNGVAEWTAQIERWLSDAVGVPLGTAAGPYAGESYVGRPLLVTANDYALGLFNGDTGVVIETADGGLRAAFRRGTELVTFAPGRLADVTTCHAMTVHRSQGSQFDRVTLVLPGVDSQLATRELLYTAVTRAREHVRLLGSVEAVRAGIERPAVRASGLRARLLRG